MTQNKSTDTQNQQSAHETEADVAGGGAKQKQQH